MVEHPSKVTTTDEAGDRHLAIVDSVSITEVSPIGSKDESSADLGRFEIRDEDALVWSIAYGPRPELARRHGAWWIGSPARTRSENRSRELSTQ